MNRPRVDIQSLNRCFDLLEALAKAGEPLGLSELARQIGIPPSTVYGLLSTMTYRGYVQKCETSYILGPSCFRLGRSFAKTWNLSEFIDEALENVRDQTGERVTLGVLVNNEILYLKVFESFGLLRLKPNIEDSRLLHCTAMGKVLLASLSAKTLQELLAATDLPQMTSKTICNKDQLIAHLAEVRKQGYSMSVEEEIEGLVGVAVPVRLGRLGLSAGVCVAAPMIRWTDQHKEEAIQWLQKAAKTIETKMGFTDFER